MFNWITSSVVKALVNFTLPKAVFKYFKTIKRQQPNLLLKTVINTQNII